MAEPYQILLIEDNEADAELIQLELNKLSVETNIQIINNKKELSVCLQNDLPQLIISKYNLSEFTGINALHMVREQYPDLPFILVSKNIGEEKAVDFMLEGASDYAMKDNPERLRAAVERELQSYDQNLQNKQELKEVKQRLQSIIDSVDGIVWEADAQAFEIEFVSSQAEQLLGYNPQEWMDTPNFWQEHIHPEDREKAVSYCYHKTQEGENHEFEYRMLNARGEYIWLRDYVTVTTQNGEPDQLRGIMVDITEQKKIEKQRDKAYQIADIGHWELDPINNELHWSDVVKNLHEVDLDYKPDLDSAIAFFKEGKDRQKIREVVKRAIEIGDSFEVELRIVTAKGNQRWIRAVGEAELRNGECVRIFGSTQDITNRKEIEQKLRDVVEYSTNMFYRHDTDHVLSYVSPQVVDFLGCSPDEATKRWTEFATDHPVNKKGLQATQKAIDTGKAQPAFPLQLKKTTGEKIWVRVNQAPITENGETVAIVGSLTNITEQKELQDLLRQTNRLAKIGSWEIDFSENETGDVYWSEMTREILEVEEDYQPSVEETITYCDPQSRKQAKKAFKEAVANGTDYDNEILIRTGKGNKRWIRNIGQAEFKDGKCVRVYGSFQDITDQKISKKKYQDLFDLSPHPMWVYDLGTLRFLDVNQAAIEQYGYSKEEFLNSTLTKVLKDGDASQNIPQNGNRKEGDFHFDGVYEHITKKGDVLQAKIKSNIIDYEGRKAELEIAENITEKLEAERKLELSEQKFKSLVQEGADMIAVVDKKGNFKYLSPNYEQLTGWHPEELQQENAFEFIHPDDQPFLKEVLKKLRNHNERLHTLPFRFKHKDGHWLWVESAGSPFGEESAVDGIVINSHDVTERKYYTDLERIERDILEKNTIGNISLRALAEKLLQKLEDLHPHMTCSIQKVKDGTLQNLAAPSLSSDYLDEIEGLSIGNNTGSCGTSAYLKEPVIAENIYEDPRWKDYRHLGEKFDFSACWSQPVIDSNRKVLATLAIYYDSPHTPCERVKNTIDRVVHLIRLLFDSYEKEKAEQQLALREQQFKSLVQDGSDLIAILDQDAIYKYVAPSAESILGISPEEFIGTNALDYIHEKHTDRVQQVLASLSEKERIKIEPFLFKNDKGEWRWIETVFTNLLDNPAVEGYVANARDVTSQIEREQKLQESLERYEYVTKATDDVVYDWDVKKDILEWDDSYREKFLYDIGKGLYTIQDWAQNVHPDDLSETQESLNHILENTAKSKWEQEYRFQKKNGSYATVFERGFIIRDKQGNAIRMIGSLQDITERKDYEEKLEELALVASKTTDIIFMTDPNEEITWVNDAFEQVLGYKFDEVVGKSPGNILGGADNKQQTMNRISNAFKTQKALQQVVLNYSKTGDKYWFDLTLDPIFDNNGDCDGFIAIQKDVTEQIKRQKKLSESVDRYKSVSKATSDTIWDLDLEEDTIQYNQNIYNMFGYEKQQVEKVGDWWRNNLHPDDRPEILETIEEALRSSSERFQMEYRFQCVDGSYKYIYDRAFIVNDKDDKPIRMIGAMQDVTQQRKERKWLQLFQSAIASTKESVAIIEGKPTELPGRKILYVNQAFCEMTGYTSEEAKGETLSILNGPKTSEDKREKLKHAMENWESCEVEFINYKKDGQEVWVRVSMTPVVRANNSYFWVCVGRDITEKKQQESVLRKSLQEKETLLLEIHHRVKNNLAVVSGMMQLQAYEENDMRLKEKLFASVARIQTMGSIHELLYKSESFSSLKFDENIKKLVENVTQTLQSDLELDITFDIQSMSLNINQAIPSSLIVNEVITNIIKHAFPKQKDGEIHVSAYEENGKVFLSIKDNGRGLPSDFGKQNSTDSLGLQLIDTLSTQLEVEYNYQSISEGSEFNLTFEKAEVKGVGNVYL